MTLKLNLNEIDSQNIIVFHHKTYPDDPDRYPELAGVTYEYLVVDDGGLFSSDTKLERSYETDKGPPTDADENEIWKEDPVDDAPIPPEVPGQ